MRRKEYYTRQRRAKLKKVTESYSTEEWDMKVDNCNGVCPMCGNYFEDIFPFCATIDHTPPISKAPVGFIYTINNVEPLCGSCNSSKNNR